MTSIDKIIGLALEGEDGRYWYHHAKAEIYRTAFELGILPTRLSDLIALFSPRVSVVRNIRLAIYYATTGQFHPTTMRTIRASVHHYEFTGEIRGPKTGPFAAACNGCEDSIVLDVWMAKMFKVDQKILGRSDIQAKCFHRIRKASDKLGWTPAQVQAAVWCATVRRAGRRPGRMQIITDTLYGPIMEIAA